MSSKVKLIKSIINKNSLYKFEDLCKLSTNELNILANSSINNCLYVEQYLRSSVSSACKCLDGFDASKMEPIDYISSSDVKNKFVDICLGKKVVATINLTTGEITSVNIPKQET